MTIADTDVLIDYLAGRGAALTVERYLALGKLRTTAITRFELLSGTRNAKEEARVNGLLAAIPCIAFDEAAADAASSIRRDLEQRGIGIGMADSMIAGIVTVHDGALLTRNRRHFERVPGLRLI